MIRYIYILLVIVAISTLAISQINYISWQDISSNVGEFTPLSARGTVDRVILILTPGMTQHKNEFLNYKEAGITAALVSANTGGGEAHSAAAATISAGARARGIEELIFVEPYAECQHDLRQKSEYFADIYGTDIPKSGTGVLNMTQIKQSQKPLSHRVDVGAVGDAVKSSGLKTAYFGGLVESDSGALTVIDRCGVIDYFETDLVKEHYPAPFDRSDYTKIARKIDDLPADVALITAAISDLNNIPDWFPEQYTADVVHDIFADLYRMISALNTDNTGIILLDPLQDEGAEMGLISYPCSTEGKALLSSFTTRRPGIISLEDIAPSIRDMLGLPPESGFGRPLGIVSTAEKSPAQGLKRLHTLILQAKRLRAPLGQFMASMVVISAILHALGVLWLPFLYSVGSRLLAAVALLPLAVFLSPGIQHLTPTIGLLFTWIMLLIPAEICRRNYGIKTTAFLVAALTILLLGADQLFGGRWAGLSPLGYCLSAGARYYGIGNEFLGILAGACIVIWGINPGSKVHASKFWGYFSTLLLVFSTLVVISPDLGANFGGGVTFIIWLLGLYLWNRIKKVDLKSKTFAVTGAILLFLAVVPTVLMWHGNTASEVSTHVGRLFVGQSGETYIEVIMRKAATAVRVFRYTIWTRIWLVILAVYGLIAFKPVGWIKDAFERWGNLEPMCKMSVILSIGLLLGNDSGVVTAALTVLNPIAVMSLTVEEEVARTKRTLE